MPARGKMPRLLSPAVRYVLPFAVWLGLTQLQNFFAGQVVFWIYGIKTAITGLLLVVCFKGRGQEIRGSFDFASIGIGAAVLFLWLLCSAFFVPSPPAKASFDPLIFHSPLEQFSAVSFRILGAVLIVPWVEELFWRAFLMRFLISNDFLKIPLGAYSHFSFWLTAAAFALFHSFGDWPGALIAGILYGGYLVKTKIFSGCVLAHATTNLGLAVYILATKSWWMWG